MTKKQHQELLDKISELSKQVEELKLRPPTYMPAPYPVYVDRYITPQYPHYVLYNPYQPNWIPMYGPMAGGLGIGAGSTGGSGLAPIHQINYGPEN